VKVLNSPPRAAAPWLAALTLALAGTAGLRAQIAINSISTTLVTGTPTTTSADNGAETVTFDNNQLEVSSFTTTSGATYFANVAATKAIIDRNPGGDTFAPNEYSQWYAYTGTSGSPTYEGTYQSNANTALLGNNLYEGSDNLFTNDNGNTQSSNDVERLDFILNQSGESATTGQAFAVFDRGNDSNHDSFKIAVITAVDANGNPTAYGGNLITVTPAEYDTSLNPEANQNYTVFRYDDTASPSNISDSDNVVTGASIASTDLGTQGVGGVVLTMAQLGITSGTTIYGYSIMAADVYSTATTAVTINATVSADLTNYLNTSIYPTNTSDNTTTGDGNYGGIDLMAVNGIEFSTTKVTPEPAAYGALFVGLSLAAFAFLRRRRPAVSALGA
jgi:hypothetical protein